MVAFAVQKLLSFIRSHLFVFILITLGGGSKNFLLRFMSESVLPMFSSKSFILSGLNSINLHHIFLSWELFSCFKMTLTLQFISQRQPGFLHVQVLGRHFAPVPTCWGPFLAVFPATSHHLLPWALAVRGPWLSSFSACSLSTWASAHLPTLWILRVSRILYLNFSQHLQPRSSPLLLGFDCHL